MESEPKFGIDHNAPPLPTGLFNTSMKLEKADNNFYIENLSPSSSSKNYLQDFNHLDQFLLTASSFDPDMNTHEFIAYNPFLHGSFSNFDLYENKLYEGNGINGEAAMQGGGFLNNFPNRKDQMMEIESALICYDPQPLSVLVPDEISCVTADFQKEDGIKREKTTVAKSGSVSTKKSAIGRRKSRSGKGQWSSEEDRQLINLVEKYGERKWSRIAQMVKGRIGKQCRERWHNHLRPDIKKDLWTEEEDRILIEAHAEVGNKWAEIAKRLLGRTENSIKNHWNATKRRQFSRRKCRTKWPRPSSLLQNYIKSLNFEKGSSTKSRNASSSPNISANFSDMDLIQADHIVRDYDVPDLSFMDSLPQGPVLEFDGQPCFDVELPFELPVASIDAV